MMVRNVPGIYLFNSNVSFKLFLDVSVEST